MAVNSTVTAFYHHYHSEKSVDEPQPIDELSPLNFGSPGAALFLVVVILWYAMGIFCMLGMQIRARADTIEDCTSRRTKLFLQTLRDQTQTKEILEELADKGKREKLWSIYLGKTDYNKEKLKRAELRRIANIKKQLAAINRNRQIMNETIQTPVLSQPTRRTSFDSQSTFVPNLSLIDNQIRSRRRSSYDQQIIERWRALVSQSSTHEQLPWTIRKLLIGRHFRRYCKTLPDESEQMPTRLTDSSLMHEHFRSMDTEHCHLLPPDQHDNRSHLSRMKKEPTDRLNPYVTYFHLPLDEQLESNVQNLPPIDVISDHQVVHLYVDESRC